MPPAERAFCTPVCHGGPPSHSSSGPLEFLSGAGAEQLLDLLVDFILHWDSPYDTMCKSAWSISLFRAFSFWKLTLFCFSMVLCQSSTMIGFLFFFLLVSFSKDPMALSSLVSFSKDPSSSSSSSPFTTRSSFCPSFALLPLLTWPSGVAAAFSKAGSAAFSKAVFCFFSYSYTGWKMKQLDFCLFAAFSKAAACSTRLSSASGLAMIKLDHCL